MLTLLLILGIPLSAVLLLTLRIRTKEARRERYLAKMEKTFREAGAETLGNRHYRRGDRTYSFDANLSPLFAKGFTLRLSTFSDSVCEFELKSARNVPIGLPEELARDEYFRSLSLQGEPAPELVPVLLDLKDRLSTLVPDRWEAFSKQHMEVILSGNRFDDGAYSAVELRSDLDALDALASAPLRRTIRGGVVTYREGFESDLPAWHWTPDQRRNLPPSVRRFVFSCYADNPYLNTAIVDLLYRLAGDRRKFFVTDQTDLEFLRYGFGDAFTQSGNLVEADNPEVPVAADQYLDGEFFGGFLASGAPVDFAGQPRHAFHNKAVERIDQWHFYARRLFDDEFSWFSGEYEIVSCVLRPADIREAVEGLADRIGARFVELDRRFSFKLLKDDRLEMTT